MGISKSIAKQRARIILQDEVAKYCTVEAAGECGVCYEERVLYKSPMCGHQWCRECINKCQNKCPMCRGKLVNRVTQAQFDENMIERLRETGLVD